MSGCAERSVPHLRFHLVGAIARAGEDLAQDAYKVDAAGLYFCTLMGDDSVRMSVDGSQLLGPRATKNNHKAASLIASWPGRAPAKTGPSMVGSERDLRWMARSVRTLRGETGAKKEGQPVPDSNFSLERNRSVPQQTHR